MARKFLNSAGFAAAGAGIFKALQGLFGGVVANQAQKVLSENLAAEGKKDGLTEVNTFIDELTQEDRKIVREARKIASTRPGKLQELNENLRSLYEKLINGLADESAITFTEKTVRTTGDKDGESVTVETTLQGQRSETGRKLVRDSLQKLLEGAKEKRGLKARAEEFTLLLRLQEENSKTRAAVEKALHIGSQVINTTRDKVIPAVGEVATAVGTAVKDRLAPSIGSAAVTASKTAESLTSTVINTAGGVATSVASKTSNAVKSTVAKANEADKKTASKLDEWKRKRWPHRYPTEEGE